MATRAQPHTWTYDDLLALPDDGTRYEIIDGELYPMPAPNAVHATIIINLIVRVFGPLIDTLGLRLLTAPLDVFLGDARPVQPDLLVLLPDQLGLLGDRGVEGPPALVVEVLSPSNPEHDRITKRAAYARGGVREYWLVSPEAAIVEILALAGDRYRTHARVAGDEPLSSLVLPTLAAPAALIFPA